ncbi:MAG: hypothetical protein LUD72_02705 [Bacteroidales bacterium]|nr:hypothetical protein [Bacteroidales bacterium]
MKSAKTNQYILKEDPDTVTKEDGTVLHNHDKDSYPFFFDRGMGMLVMGGAGVLHDDMLGDVYDALGQYAPDEEEQDNYYNAFVGEYESADPNLVTGRIWTDGRVISLWMPTDKKTLEDITYCFDSEYGINTDGYQLDMGNKTVSLDDFLYGEEEQTPEFTHPEVHTMSPSEKWASPQLTGARETANKNKVEKLGSTPEAKYNFYRRYGMGDSVQRNGQLLFENPDSVYFNNELDLSYEDDEAYPFVYDLETKHLFIAGEGCTHEWIENEIEEYLSQSTDWYDTDRKKVYDFIHRVLSRKTDSSVIGRLWCDHKVISFWKMPTTQFALKETIDALSCAFWSDIWAYNVEVDTGLVPLESLMGKDKTEETHFDLNTIHNLPAEEKWNTPQLKGARATRDSSMAQKLGNTSQAEYNFYRRYGMGDSAHHNEHRLNESPDTVRIGKNSELTFNDDDAFPFVYDLKSKHLFISDFGNTHGDIEWEIEYYLTKERSFSYGDAENYARRIASRKSRNSIVGRIWSHHHVISFWKMPSSPSALKETVDALCKELGQDVWSYNVDVRKGRLVPLKSLMKKEKPEETHFDLDTIHNLSPKEKWGTSQLKGARETANQAKAKKLGSTPEVEYNFYRRYGMGDSQQHEGQPLTESPDSLIWTNEWGKPEEICYLADDACPFFYDTEKNDLYLYPHNITHYGVIAWIKWLMKKKYPEMTDVECEKRAKEADNRRSAYGFSGRIWKNSEVISFWVTPPVDILEKIVKKFNEQRIRIQDYTLDLYDFADSTTLGDYIENEKETDYSGMEPEPWFDLDIVHNLPAEEKWNTPQLKGARETADKVKVDKLKGMTQAEYNFYKNYGLGDSVQHQKKKLTESPDYMFGVRDGEPVEGDFHNYESKAFVYDVQTKKFYVGSERSQHAHLFDWIVDEVLNDNPDWYVEDAEEYVRDLLARNSDTGINGRVWFDVGVVSFWNVPSIDVLKDMVDNCDFNLKDFYVDEENCDEEMKTVGQILCSGRTKATNFDFSTIHNMNAKEKHDSPQLTGARETADRVKSEKLGNTPEAEYNFYRRYGMGDSKENDSTKQINEVEAENISLQSFVPQDELNPRFWVNGKLNSNVRIKLLQIAHNFMDESKVNWVEPEDVVLTGSIANYNWSKYSDVDVHIILDYKKVWKKTEFVEDYFGDKKELWSNTHPNLKIYGFPVEVYVEDLNAPADSSGIFSLLTNEWLKEPVDFNDSSINGEYVKSYAARIETKIDNIIAKMKKERNARKIEDYSKALQAIFDKLKNIRKEGLKKGGEMGSGNIIWKICKRMGYIDKLWNYVNLAYDKTHSLT